VLRKRAEALHGCSTRLILTERDLCIRYRAPKIITDASGEYYRYRWEVATAVPLKRQSTKRTHDEHEVPSSSHVRWLVTGGGVSRHHPLCFCGTSCATSCGCVSKPPIKYKGCLLACHPGVKDASCFRDLTLVDNEVLKRSQELSKD
jgi:hypothetical protein